jgi:hypothetical protein
MTVLFAAMGVCAGCAQEAEPVPAAATETPLAVASLATASTRPLQEDDVLAAERAALEKQRAEVEALRAKLAEAEKDRDEAVNSRKTRRTTRSRKRSETSSKTGTSGRRKIVLDPDDGNPI